nr:AbgT family transporter [Fusobacterium ulcerans]
MVGFMAKYPKIEENMRLGSVITMILPYFMVFLVAWIPLLILNLEHICLCNK